MPYTGSYFSMRQPLGRQHAASNLRIGAGHNLVSGSCQGPVGGMRGLQPVQGHRRRPQHICNSDQGPGDRTQKDFFVQKDNKNQNEPGGGNHDHKHKDEGPLAAIDEKLEQFIDWIIEEQGQEAKEIKSLYRNVLLTVFGLNLVIPTVVFYASYIYAGVPLEQCIALALGVLIGVPSRSTIPVDSYLASSLWDSLGKDVLISFGAPQRQNLSNILDTMLVIMGLSYFVPQVLHIASEMQAFVYTVGVVFGWVLAEVSLFIAALICLSG